MTDALHIVCPHCEAVNRVPSDRIGAAPVCGKCHKPLFEGKPLEANQAAFRKHISRNGIPVLVDFWAPWCGPCRQVAPVLEAIYAEYGDKIDVVKLNTDENPLTQARYSVRSIPTLNVYSGGEVVKTVVGAKPKHLLLKDLADFVG